MKLTKLAFFGLLATAALAPASLEAQIAYTGLTILDPAAERRISNSYIIVDGGRITHIGQGAPPSSIVVEQRHDFSGRFAMPGLFDTHAHVTLGPVTLAMVDGSPQLNVAGSDAITRHDALMLLAHGVTTIRDPGGDTGRMVAYRDAVAAGRLRGPEARVAGAVIDRSAFPVNGLVDRVTDENPVAPIVASQATDGVDFIKLYEALTEQDLAAGIAAANAAGRTTIGHLSEVSWTRAAELGIDALVHAMPISPDLLPADRRDAYRTSRRPGPFAFFEWYEQADLDAPEIRQMIATLAERQIPVDATMIAFELAFRGDDTAYRERDVAFAHPSMVENWRTAFRFDLGWEPKDYARARAIWPKVLRFVRMLHDGGVVLTIGTDMNNPFVAPGVSVRREMALYADAGIPQWAILRMATVDAARSLGLAGQTGQLAPGMEADILILEEDPSRDIQAISQVAAVITNGRLHDPAELMAEAERGR